MKNCAIDLKKNNLYRIPFHITKKCKISWVFYAASSLFLAGVVHKEEGSANFYGTKGYSWTGHHIEDLGDNRLAISAHMAKLNYVINTGGEVKIVDYDLNEILTIPNPELHSDQFGYSMIATDLIIDGKLRNELGTVGHIFFQILHILPIL